MRLFLVFFMVSWVCGQDHIPEVNSSNPNIKAKVVDSKTKTVELVVDEDTIVDFSHARVADLLGQPVAIQLKDKVTLIEYWSKNAADSNLYWNKTRDLENLYKNHPFVQIISINYDNALAGKPHRDAVVEYLKKVTPPMQTLVDQDDGIRDIFSLTGSVAYLLFNHTEQFVISGRGDDPQAERVFEELTKAVASKQKWDAYKADMTKKLNEKKK